MARYTSSVGSSTPSTPNYFYNPSGAFGTCGVRFFTTSGTFTVPSSSVRVRVWGAGGGALGAAGAGGGGAGFAMKTITGLTPGTNVSITVGAFTAGVAGATSSFGSYVSATGGDLGGRSAATCFFANGGIGICGDINCVGGFSCNCTCAGGGGGSANYFGAGGNFCGGACSSTSGAGQCFTTVPLTPGGNGLTGAGSICCVNATASCAYLPWTYLDYYGTGGGGGGLAAGFNGGGWGATSGSGPGSGGSPNPVDCRSGLVIVEF
jgi:hypothetical protein